MINRTLRLLMLALTATCSSMLQAAINEPVKVEAGLVSGVPARDASITVYKGVPFAAPPVGELRWRAPQPAIPWQGVRKADQFGNGCFQVQMQRDVSSGSEDCLYLNVWTGANSSAERRPVFVWIYGGRFTLGAGSDALFDGEGLARKGVVVVTMNYRLGVFGFLATPELSQESGHNSSGNYGVLDQIAALQWVKKNIAAFGGDPNRVTIAGQSAGGASVLLLTDSPLAKGLYHRAIIESRARSLRSSLQTAERAGVKYGEAHGAHNLKELRALSWDQLKAGNNGNDEEEGGPLFRPVVDGWVIPLDYKHYYVKGLPSDIPVIAGNNLDESGASPQPNAKLNQFQSDARKKYGPIAEEFLKLYPATSDQEASLAQNAAARDDSRIATFLLTTQAKRKNKVYTYFWEHAPPGPDREKRGAYHESEINYIFNNLYATNRPWEDADWKIADTMSSYWANFAATGDPNGKGLPKWPATEGKSPVVMEVGNRFGPMPVAEKSRLDFFRRYYLGQEPW